MGLSEELFDRAVKVIPGGVNSPVRAYGAIGIAPRFIDRADGCHIYDVDGKEYVDYIDSWGPMILGHNFPEVKESVLKACEKGLSFGCATAIEVEMAEFICNHIPHVDMVRMVNSGTEAVMSAVRVARGFERKTGFIPLTFVCFKDYDESIPNKKVAFKKENIKNTFGEFLANHGKKQLRLAETEKYAHVTFFFNGGVEDPNVDEFRLLVNSPKDVATYDLKPEMSAPEVGMDLVEAIKSDKYDVIIINFANPDMVGHTGVIPAAIKAVEKVDELVGKAVDAVKDVDGVLFICADHGNAEKMIDYETGAPHTAHTTNPVPFILVNYDENYTLREGGRLCDIAPTLIEIMGLEKPVEMTGESLLVKKN